jgi:hypothetical protein
MRERLRREVNPLHRCETCAGRAPQPLRGRRRCKKQEILDDFAKGAERAMRRRRLWRGARPFRDAETKFWPMLVALERNGDAVPRRWSVARSRMGEAILAGKRRMEAVDEWEDRKAEERAERKRKARGE